MRDPLTSRHNKVLLKGSYYNLVMIKDENIVWITMGVYSYISNT